MPRGAENREAGESPARSRHCKQGVRAKVPLGNREGGKDNDLLELSAADESFGLTLEELQENMDPAKYTGRAEYQVEQYLKNVIQPILDANKDVLGMTAEINV